MRQLCRVRESVGEVVHGVRTSLPCTKIACMPRSISPEAPTGAAFTAAGWGRRFRVKGLVQGYEFSVYDSGFRI